MSALPVVARPEDFRARRSVGAWVGLEIPGLPAGAAVRAIRSDFMTPIVVLNGGLPFSLNER